VDRGEWPSFDGTGPTHRRLSGQGGAQHKPCAAIAVGDAIILDGCHSWGWIGGLIGCQSSDDKRKGRLDFFGPFPNHQFNSNPDSAVQGEAQDKAQAFRSERNRPVPLSLVAGIGAMRASSTAPTKCQVTKKL